MSYVKFSRKVKKLTHVTEIIDKNHFLQNIWIGAIKHRVNGSEKDTPRLIMKDNDHRGRRQRVVPLDRLAGRISHVRQGSVQRDHVASVGVERVLSPASFEFFQLLRAQPLLVDSYRFS
jgi:hypothetical protein